MLSSEEIDRIRAVCNTIAPFMRATLVEVSALNDQRVAELTTHEVMERQVWSASYAAALSNSDLHQSAKEYADRAVYDFNMRFPNV